MNKFLGLCAVFLLFLVSAVAALPQEHLAPAVHSKKPSNLLAKRHIKTSAAFIASLDARQVHNADYGSNNGPTGNPQTAQQTTEATQSPTPTPAAHDAEATPEAADESSKAQERRDFKPNPPTTSKINDIKHKAS